MDPSSNYLRDLGSLLREHAVTAKRTVDASDVSQEAWERGRLHAYYEVIDLMLAQAEAFGMSPESVGLLGFDPTTELLGP